MHHERKTGRSIVHNHFPVEPRKAAESDRISVITNGGNNTEKIFGASSHPIQGHYVDWSRQQFNMNPIPTIFSMSWSRRDESWKYQLLSKQSSTWSKKIPGTFILRNNFFAFCSDTPARAKSSSASFTASWVTGESGWRCIISGWGSTSILDSRDSTGLAAGLKANSPHWAKPSLMFSSWSASVSAGSRAFTIWARVNCNDRRGQSALLMGGVVQSFAAFPVKRNAKPQFVIHQKLPFSVHLQVFCVFH